MSGRTSGPTTDGAAIRTEGLTRVFTRREGVRRVKVTAVEDLTVTVERGESVGYIGANGAGKSTTVGREPVHASV